MEAGSLLSRIGCSIKRRVKHKRAFQLQEDAELKEPMSSIQVKEFNSKVRNQGISIRHFFGGHVYQGLTKKNMMKIFTKDALYAIHKECKRIALFEAFEMFWTPDDRYNKYCLTGSLVIKYKIIHCNAKKVTTLKAGKEENTWVQHGIWIR